MEIKLLGTRGSMPTGGERYIKYGSDTSSYLVTTENIAVFFDAGTGICHAPDVSKKRIVIILSHFHLDHILGLPFFPLLSKKIDVEIFSAFEPERAYNVIDRVFSKPVWPCKLCDYDANISYKKIDDKIELGDLTVSVIPGNHPDGCFIFKAETENASVCYATDYEHGSRDEALIGFAKNASCLIYDGQYTVEEFEKYKGYGHSTKERGIEIAKLANVERVVFTHHDPRHDDDFLEREENHIQGLFKNASLAKQGEVIKL